MALTRVAPAGIGSTPGTGYVIGDSFLHSRGLNAIDANYTGIVTAQSIRVIGDLQVDGTTTTLDTAITEVDKLEVGANNNTVGVAITQSGTGDIFNLYDGSTEVFSVRDGGNVGIKNATGLSEFPVDVGGEIASKNANKEFIGINLTNNEARIRSSYYSGASGAYRPITFYTSDAERLRITSDGKVGIGSDVPRYPLDVHGGNLLVSGSAAGNLILEDRGVGDSSRPFYVVSSDGGKFVINRSNRNASGTTTSSVNSLTLSSSGNLGLGPQTNPTSNIHIADLSANGYELKISGNALQFNRSSNSYIDQLHDTGSILFRMGSSYTEAMRITSDGTIRQSGRSNALGQGTSVAKLTHYTIDGTTPGGIGDVTTLETISATSNGSDYKFIITKREGSGGGSCFINLGGNSDGSISFGTNTSGSGTERLRIDSSGRLGLGVAPEAYHANNKAVIRGDSGYAILGRGNNSLNISQNFYYDSSDAGKYIANGEASVYNQSDGQHVFYSAVSGSANAGAPLVERLRIRAAGPHLLIGTGGDATYNEITESSSNAGLVIGSSSMGNGGIVIRNSTSGTGRIYFADNSGSDPGRQRGQINYYHNGDYMMFATAGSERLRITSAGGVKIGSGNDDASMSEFGSNTGGLTIDDAGVSNTGIRLSHGNDDTYLVQAGNSNFYIAQYGTGNMIFGVGSSGNERLRITSAGQMILGTASNLGSVPPKLTIVNNTNSNTFSECQLLRLNGPSGVGERGGIGFHYAQSLDYGEKPSSFIGVETVAAGGAQQTDLLFATRPNTTDSEPTERLRIDSNGKVHIYGSLGAGHLPLGGNAAAAALHVRGTTKYQGIAFGQSLSNATIGIDNTKLVYTANANPANLGGGKQTAHEWWSGSSGGGGPNKIAEMTTDGDLYLGGYPLTHTVAGGSHLKLRAGDGAWGISLGMRSSQNDYAYIGFTDMNGTENIGDIFMQRTGTSAGHMVFSTNNGTGGSENRLKIGSSGRLCYSPDASFAQESTNIAMSIVASGGDVAGYPGINIRSTASGGGTNSMNGMSILSTDGNWSLYTNSGNVHGLGLFAGNSATSGNCGLYVRSDKKITMGPETNNEAFTTNTCGQAVHIAGGSLGIGALSNYSDQSGTGGRDVRGWYHANAYTGRSNNAYLHLTTSLWGGGSPHGNSEYIMGGFRLTSYRYSPGGVAEELIMFHNWSGGVPGYTRNYRGSWDPGSYVYVRGSGFVTIRLTSQNYVGHIIDLIQYNWYPVRDIRVTSANFSNTATL